MRNWALYALALVCVGCAGPLASAVPAVTSTHLGTISIVIHVPRPPVASQRTDRRLFVASQTASIVFTLKTTSGNTLLSQTFDVTPTSNGCSVVSATTTCIESVAAAPGAYLADFVTYDAANGTGRTLGETQNVAVSVSLGVANQVPITVYGVPASIVVSGGSSTITGSQSTGFTLYGTADQPFTLIAKDADGNIILGPGAPAWTVTPLSTSGSLTYSAPSPGSDALTLALPGNATDSITVAATYGDATVCQQAGAHCNVTFSVTHSQLLFYCMGGALEELAPPYTGRPVTVASATCDDTSTWLDHDATGDIYFMNAGRLEIFAPPYGSAVTNVTGLPVSNIEFAIDAGKDVLLCEGSGALDEIAPPYVTVTTVLSNPSCAGMANLRFDATSLIMSTSSGAAVVDPPYQAVVGTLPIAFDSFKRDAIAVSPSGELAFGGASNVEVYASKSAATGIAVSSGSQEVQFDDAGNLWAAVVGSGTVTTFSPPFTAGEQGQQHSLNPFDFERVRFDGQGDALIATNNYGIAEIPAASTTARFTGGSIQGVIVYSMTLTP